MIAGSLKKPMPHHDRGACPQGAPQFFPNRCGQNADWRLRPKAVSPFCVGNEGRYAMEIFIPVSLL